MESSSKEARIILAIQAINKDPKLSIRASAAIFSIPWTTVRDRINGAASQRDFIPKSRKLTNSEESAILEQIIDLDSRAFPPRLSAVEDMANLLLATRNASDASDPQRVGVK